MTSPVGRMGFTIPLLLFVSLFLNHSKWVSAASCPWDDGGLKPWSDSSTWDKPPKNNGKVVIPKGLRVLLDTQPPVLSSLKIEKGAALVWGNVPDITLQTDYILVEGEFHMGSEDCPLTKPASIKLTGRSDSENFVSDKHISEIRKVILVREDATLEIHGMKKTPWTRLAQTVHPLQHYKKCGLVYDHSDHEANPFAAERGSVNFLHAIAWTQNGAVMDYVALDDFKPLKDFVDTLPDGTVIGVYAFGQGFCCKKKSGYSVLLDVIKNSLGGKLIDDVEKTDFYSLLAIKGKPEVTQEHHQAKGRITKNFPRSETFLSLPVWKTERVFQAAMSGRTTLQYFRVLSLDIAYPILELASDVTNWNPGDKVVVASTDYDFEQAEVVEIVDCQGKCDASQIRVKGPFHYMHYGNFTYDVDERAEVGLLSRNIVIEGVVEDECYSTNKDEKKRCDKFQKDTFGGHIRVLKDHAAAHVEGVELYHMGQQGVSGSYPLHFHMCEEAPESWFKYNSIHHSFQRCVTLHGTDNVTVAGNVCYEHLGHGYFLEDGVEQNNIIDGNLGLSTRHGTLLLSDSDKEWCEQNYKDKSIPISCQDTTTFWISHPNNIVTNNAAAGGVRHGYAFIFAEMPLGLSYERQWALKKVMNYSARYTAITKFYNNFAHSYDHSGIFIDSHISTGKLGAWEKYVPENGIVQEENYYEPRDPPGKVTNERTWKTTLERFTGYKNKRNNMWIKGGNINVTFSSLADGSMQSFSGGCTGKWTGVSVEYCVFIGRSDNLGEPRYWVENVDGQKLTVQLNHSVGSTPWQTIRGVAIYQGPMYVKHTYFDRFTTEYWADSWTKVLGKRPFSPAGAISFKRDSTYPTYTSQYTTNLTFGFCDNKDESHWVFWGNDSLYGWDDEDGTKAAHNLDRDGSLTGTPNTYIVRDRPFFTGPECTSRPDWNMAMCPYRYVKLEFLGEGGSMTPEHRANWPLIAYRDDVPEDPYTHEGRQRREYLVRTYSSYLIDYNLTAPWAAWPEEVKVLAHGVEKQDVVRVGICMPRSMTKFEVRSDYPLNIKNDNYTAVDSLKELDADKNNGAFFHDKDNGILFLKIWSRYDRTNDSQLCTAGQCYKLRIILKDGFNEKMRSCYGNSKYDAFKDLRESKPKKVPMPDKCSSQGSPSGIGAVRWNEVPKIIYKEKEIPCTAVSAVPEGREETPKCHGCFVVDEQSSFELETKLSKSMTVEWCTKRCYYRGYKYAGLKQASVCSCGQEINSSETATTLKGKMCDTGCSGNKEQNCGTGNRMAIWSTGLALSTPPPDNPVGC